MHKKGIFFALQTFKQFNTDMRNVINYKRMRGKLMEK
jgi:hypothetical protein